MYIKLKNIISNELAQDLINIYKRKNDVGVINKEVFEFRTSWDRDVHQMVTDYLNHDVIPYARENWEFGKFKYTNIKIRKYPTGSFYKEHVDFHRPAPDKIYLSFSIVLNDAFTGGELRIGDKIFDNRQNNGILFEATELHEVLPIKTGYRMALIGHFIGDRLN